MSGRSGLSHNGNLVKYIDREYLVAISHHIVTNPPKGLKTHPLNRGSGKETYCYPGLEKVYG